MRALLLALPIVAGIAYFATRRAPDGSTPLDLLAINFADYAPAPTVDAPPADGTGFVQSIELAGSQMLSGLDREFSAVTAAIRNALQISPAGVDKLTTREGFSATPYKDTAGNWTIGYGHLIKAGESFSSITEAEARALLEADLAEAQRAVQRNVAAPVSQNQFDALVSFVYNIGGDAFKNSTLLAKLNAGDVAGAAAEFKRWIYSGGKVTDGLVNRRTDEATQFLA